MSKLFFFFDEIHTMYQRSEGIKAFFSFNKYIFKIIGLFFWGFVVYYSIEHLNSLREDIKNQKSELHLWRIIEVDRVNLNKKDSIIFILTKAIGDYQEEILEIKKER